MKIKHKLHIGFGILFVVVIFFGTLSLFYLNQISNSSRVILKDNYASLAFVRDMRSILDENDLPLTSLTSSRFNATLIKEQNNITEKGEAEAVANLKQNFESLRNSSLSLDQQQQAKKRALKYLVQIEKLNMDAVVHKSDRAEQTIKNATLYLAIAGAFTFLVLFSFIFNLAAFFEEPLRLLTEGVREVSKRNFGSKLELDRQDEFGEASQAFNEMVENLNEWYNEKNAEIVVERKRTEVILKNLLDPVIVLNENEEIILMNPAAERLLSLENTNVAGLKARELSEQNENLKRILNAEKGQLQVKESIFELEIQEIVAPKNHLTDVNGDKPIVTSGKSVGDVYILRKK